MKENAQLGIGHLVGCEEVLEAPVGSQHLALPIVMNDQSAEIGGKGDLQLGEPQGKNALGAGDDPIPNFARFARGTPALVESQNSRNAGILAAIQSPILKVGQDGFIGGIFGGKVVGGEADDRWFLTVWGVAGMQVQKHAS